MRLRDHGSEGQGGATCETLFLARMTGNMVASVQGQGMQENE